MGLDNTCRGMTERLRLMGLMLIERRFKGFNAVKERRECRLVILMKGL